MICALCLVALQTGAARADDEQPVELAVESSDPLPLRVVGVQIGLGWGHSAVELGVRSLLVEDSGFLMDLHLSGSYGTLDPGLGVTADLLVGWSFGWRGQVTDKITTDEAHWVEGLRRYDAYRYVEGTLPARPHFAIVGGARVVARRGYYVNGYDDQTTPYYLRFAAGFELAKRWGAMARTGSYQQYLWGYSGVRLLALVGPSEGYGVFLRKWGRFGGLIQWFQTTRMGQFRALFGLSVGVEPTVGPSFLVNLTIPFFVLRPAS